MKLEKKLVQKLEQPSKTFNQESCGCRSLDQCIVGPPMFLGLSQLLVSWFLSCLLYTSDAADEEDSVDLGGRRIIKKKSCLF